MTITTGATAVTRFAGLDVVGLTEALVAIDSDVLAGNEQEIAGFIASHARDEGFEAREVEYSQGRTNVVIDVDGGGDRVLGLSGHIDTKPVGDALAEWRTPPLELTVVDGNAYGLGASDMKGAVAAMLIAARRWADRPGAGRLRLILTADEEAGGTWGAEALAEHGDSGAEAIVVGEPSGARHSWEAIYTISRGICCFTVRIETKQGHSGMSPMHPESATLAAARAALAVRDFKPSHDVALSLGSGPTVNSAVLLDGGVFYGVHPGSASFSCDIRLVPGMTRETLDAELRSLLSSTLGPDTRFEIEYQPFPLGWIDPASIAPDHPLVAAARQAAAETVGRELPLAAYMGATDATAFILRGGVPTIASLGPGLLSVAHGPNEYVPVADLETAVDLYDRLARIYLTPVAG